MNEDTTKWLKALVMLQAQQAVAAGSQPELALSQAGLKNSEIALIVGKTQKAVENLIYRARKSQKQKEKVDE